MIGNLFKEALSSLSGSTSRSPPTVSSIASIQEDMHCRDLLFPDEQALYEHAHSYISPLGSSHNTTTNSTLSDTYDINQSIELQLKDARLIVMQEATPSLSSALLYDTHAPFDTGVKGQVSVSDPQTPRRVSIGPAIPMSNPERSQGAFERRPSAHNRSGSYAETEVQKSIREYREELNTFSGCIFGSSDIMAYKGTGTKVHIIPTDNKVYASAFTDNHVLQGRSSTKNSKLSQSYTSENLFASASPSNGQSRTSNKKKMLITRIFPVPLVNTDEEGFLDTKDGYPFPEIRADGTTKTKKSIPRQRRTPMYAIAIVLTLPTTTSSSTMRVSLKPTSYSDRGGSFSGSNWTSLGDGFCVDPIDSMVLMADDHFDIVTQHWDIIVRTLNHLQSLTASKIHSLLQEVDTNSSIFKQSLFKPRTTSTSIAGKRVEDIRQSSKPAKMNAKSVQLATNALATSEQIKIEMGHAQLRIVNGLKAQRVVTRQNRWGIWRDEARWIAKRAGGSENGLFLYNVLTSFLGTHTEWLQALGPTWYRRRHFNQSKSRDDDPPLAARTIVISKDRMTARRFIFLLSAFLAPSQQPHSPHPLALGRRPSHLSDSYSQSPEISGPVKDDGRRRKRNKQKQSNIKMTNTPAPNRPDYPRRGSDLKSANLPIPGSDLGTIKNTSTTTTNVVPVATIPHFSYRQKVRGTGPVPRPGSSGSLATDDLIRSLKRGENSSQSSLGGTDGSRWGSMSSWSGRMGFSWNRRQESSSLSSTTVEEEPQQQSSLSKMVNDSQALKDSQARAEHDLKGLAIHEPSKPLPYQSPITSSVNEEDGVIDVDVPLPDFLSSFGSAVSSPSSSGYLSNAAPGLEGFESYNRGYDTDPPINVGGWLPRFHPDFALQAIGEQLGLEDEIKACMCAEPTPSIDRAEGSHWVDVTSSLIVDTISCTVKRLRYRRFIRVLSSDNASSGPTSSASMTVRDVSQYGNPSVIHDSQSTPLPGTKVEEQFVEDVIASIDPVLLEAVEKMIAQHQPEPSSITRRGCPNDDFPIPLMSVLPGDAVDNGPSGSPPVVDVRSRAEFMSRSLPQTVGHEVSREECKEVILGALEDIARQVAQTRSAQSKEDSKDESMLGREQRQKYVGFKNCQPDSVLKEGVTSWLNAVENAV